MTASLGHRIEQTVGHRQTQIGKKRARKTDRQRHIRNSDCKKHRQKYFYTEKNHVQKSTNTDVNKYGQIRTQRNLKKIHKHSRIQTHT